MFGLSAMASFTGHNHVAPQLLLIDHIGVAAFANFMSGVGNRAGSDFRNRSTAVMAVLAEGFWDDGSTQANKHHQRDHHDDRDTDEMLDVLEQGSLSRTKGVTGDEGAVLRYWEFGVWTMIGVTTGCDLHHSASYLREQSCRFADLRSGLSSSS